MCSYKELVRKVSKKSGYRFDGVLEVLNQLDDVMEELLLSGEGFKFNSFSIDVKDVDPFEVEHPVTREKMIAPKKKKAYFKLKTGIKGRLKKFYE